MSDAAPREPPPGRRNSRAIGQAVAEQVAEGTASPLQASRLIRSLSVVESLPGEEEEEEILAEVELRGVVANGFPPRNEEEWLLAIKVFDSEAIEEFVRWERCGSGWGEPDMAWLPPIPEHLLPATLRGPQPHPSFSRKLSPFLTHNLERYKADGWDIRDGTWHWTNPDPD
ncbi:MAG: hypothetical protein C0506_15340 [Anaerolinea sp.]|nr:hypothetical protein [Anaerolinea sp.]